VKLLAQRVPAFSRILIAICRPLSKRFPCSLLPAASESTCITCHSWKAVLFTSGEFYLWWEPKGSEIIPHAYGRVSQHLLPMYQLALAAVMLCNKTFPNLRGIY
jgi:hypothetical protein